MDKIELRLLQSDIGIKNAILKMQVSLEDFKEKTPHRKDIIESMEETILDLQNVKTSYEFLKRYYGTNDLVQYFQVEEIENLKEEKEKLTNEIEKIKSNLEL
tara:strand:+ start:3936 stop:4241 length:306 start_codon:yes stop_codon:yes gene_type:complete